VVLNFFIYISSKVNPSCAGKFSRNLITHSFVDSGSGVGTGYHEKENELCYIKGRLEV